MMSPNCFNHLLEEAVICMTQGGVRFDEFTPSFIYQMITDEGVQEKWDSLSVKEQTEVSYDLMDQLQEGLIYDYEYSQESSESQ